MAKKDLEFDEGESCYRTQLGEKVEELEEHNFVLKFDT